MQRASLEQEQTQEASGVAALWSQEKVRGSAGAPGWRSDPTDGSFTPSSVVVVVVVV